jgi:hypothetical protein
MLSELENYLLLSTYAKDRQHFVIISHASLPDIIALIPMFLNPNRAFFNRGLKYSS